MIIIIILGKDIIFNDEVESVKTEARRLTSQGVKIIIALGHSGFEKDQEIARQVPEVDVVVGGHTNTFLYTGQWLYQKVCCCGTHHHFSGIYQRVSQCNYI